MFAKYFARRRAHRITSLSRQLRVALVAASNDTLYEQSTRNSFALAAKNMAPVITNIRDGLWPHGLPQAPSLPQAIQDDNR